MRKFAIMIFFSLFLVACSDSGESGMSEAEFIEYKNAMIDILESEFSLVNPNITFSLTSDREYKFYDGEVWINPLVNHQSGWMVHALSDGRIPIWLSSGIEIFAKNIAGIGESPYNNLVFFDNFGDRYFTVCNWVHRRHAQAINLSYNFVKYLHENLYLTGLLDLYLTGDREVANRLAEEHYYNFSAGRTLETAISLWPDYGQENEYGFTINIVWEHGDYRFIVSEFRTRNTPIDNLISYLEPIESLILFTKNFYREQGFTFDESRIIYDIYRVRPSRFAAVGGERVTVFGMHHGYGVYIHEASHVISRRIAMPFYPFEEGMADAMWQFYQIEVKGVNPDLLIPRVHQNALRMYTERDLNERVPFLLGGLEEEFYNESHHMFIPVLATYITSQSFVLYLIENYSIESFFEVYFDVDNFKNVYGTTLHEMVDEWLEFLRDNFSVVEE